jgi:hypothetical protein
MATKLTIKPFVPTKTDTFGQLLGAHDMTTCAYADGVDAKHNPVNPCRKHTIMTPFCKLHRHFAYFATVVELPKAA